MNVFYEVNFAIQDSSTLVHFTYDQVLLKGTTEINFYMPFKVSCILNKKLLF
jgi:hypothetical protein